VSVVQSTMELKADMNCFVVKRMFHYIKTFNTSLLVLPVPFCNVYFQATRETTLSYSRFESCLFYVHCLHSIVGFGLSLSRSLRFRVLILAYFSEAMLLYIMLQKLHPQKISQRGTFGDRWNPINSAK